MEKKCKDCDNSTTSYASLRCFSCRRKHNNETQRKNRIKYQYHKQPEHRYRSYKEGAKRRGIEFNISYEEFIKYWDNSCTYCGEDISGIGLDRKNNDTGYTIENMVVCCRTCNYMKHTMKENDFINQCTRIANNSIKK